MKVIILENIENLGRKYEVKNVKMGFFRNYLLPKKLAKILDKSSLTWLEKNKEIIQKEREEEMKMINKIANDIKNLNLVIFVKVGEKGQLFEKVNNTTIIKELNHLIDYKLNKKQVIVEPIKKIGEYKIEILLENNISTILNLKVENEKLKDKL